MGILDFFKNKPKNTANVAKERLRIIVAQERAQRLLEVAGRDALEIQPGDELVYAFDLAEVRRQNLRGEWLTLIRRPSVVHPRLDHLDGPDAGDDPPRRQTAVADDLAMTLLIGKLGMLLNPAGDLVLDRLAEQRLGPAAKDLTEHLAGTSRIDVSRDWTRNCLAVRVLHGGVLLC